ncbi:LuxR C-terminal-related transcriptional regulator [Streptomyces sp. NPDC001351]|uniref:LuxR C-terminal-related transcriptional regulator n=1 Tax=Streptomyces sp. NPDC001351 TaxID=3364564 RepID=UPI003680A3F6
MTDSERELLRLLAEGLPPDIIARRMFISARTLRRHIRALCDRVGVQTAIQAVAWAARHQVL